MAAKIHAQSVIYYNDKASLMKAMESMANAADNAGPLLDKLTIHYGDASAEPQYTKEEIEEISNRFKNSFNFEYSFFGFNSGSARGQNILSEDSSDDFIFIMNPDVIVAPNFFGEILKPMENKKVAMAEARQTPIEHHKQYDKTTFETEWATGACTLIRREVFHMLKGFDADTFFMYCDDVDLSWRVRLAGYNIQYCPAAMAYHAKRLSLNANWQPSNAEEYYSAEAAIMMAYKYSNEQRAEYLAEMFRNSGQEHYIKAAEHYYTLKANGGLPKQLDPEHKIAKFNGDYYSENRFTVL